MSTNLAHYRAPICHGPETTNEARVVHVVCTLIANPSIYSGNLNLSKFFGVVYCNVCSCFSSYPMDHIGARDLVDERFGGQTEAILLPIGVLRAVRQLGWISL